MGMEAGHSAHRQYIRDAAGVLLLNEHSEVTNESRKANNALCSQQCFRTERCQVPHHANDANMDK